MSKQAKTESPVNPNNLENAQLEASEVEAYLRQHPAFLIEHSDLLLDIQVVLSESGVVSLTQIQTEQYREKIKQLKSQLESLVSNARNNEHIYKTYSQLNIDIAQTSHLSELVEVLSKGFVYELGAEAVQLVLLNEDKNPSNIVLSEIQQHSIFDKKLANKDFYLGRLGKLEREALFPTAKAESVAIIKLGNKNPIGLLSVSSRDPLHFTPEMDTMLIDFLRKSLDFHIPKLL